MTIEKGEIIGGRYRVDTFLGKGGMAEVYKVWDQQRAVFLAMKVLNEDLADDRVFFRRFQREGQTLSLLQHPHIVRFYGLEKVGEVAFMLMDYVEGPTLRKEISRSNGPMKLNRVLEILQPICSALYYAHSQGMVHCDVKPANIMLHVNGTVLLTDFGIARMTETATTTSLLGAGTPAYMAPEQVLGQNPLPQTDLYALGIILYEMVTGGERPFTGERATSTGTTMEKVRWEQVNLAPIAPMQFNPALPPAVQAVILHCLEKDPARRFGSALEIYNAFQKAIPQTGYAAPPPSENITFPVPPQPRPLPVPPAPLPPTPPSAGKGQKGKIPILWISLAAVTVIVLVFLIISNQRGHTSGDLPPAVIPPTASFVSTALPTEASTATPNDMGQTYENTAIGISFRYPTGWTANAHDPSGVGNIELTRPGSENSLSVWIALQPLDPNNQANRPAGVDFNSPASILQNVRDHPDDSSIGGVPTDARIINDVYLTSVDGNQSASIDFSTNKKGVSGRPNTVSYYYMRPDNRLVVIEGVSPSANWPENEQIFTAIVESVHFTAPTLQADLAKPAPTAAGSVIQTVRLQNGDSYDFLTKTRSKYTGGDFYFVWNLALPTFSADAADQNGLIDLGENSTQSLDSISLPTTGYNRYGVNAVLGHVYVSKAHTSSDGHFIIFRVMGLIAETSSVEVEFLYR